LTYSLLLEESRRVLGAVNTTVGANEGSISLLAKFPNVAGRGESVSVDHTVGSAYNRASTISVKKPFPGVWNIA